MKQIIGSISFRTPSGKFLEAQPIYGEVSEEQSEKVTREFTDILTPKLAEAFKEIRNVERVAPSGD